jgi:recombination protein RecR
LIPGPIERLIEQLTRLPGVGRKTATRLAFFIVGTDDGYPTGLARSLEEVVDTIRACSNCGFLTELDPCRLCTDPKRDDAILCAVEGTPEAMAIDRTGAFRGRYHVLGGLLSPLEGVGPDQLRLGELIRRVDDGLIREVVVATAPSVEGEATAHYLAKMLHARGVQVTRIASGIPMGASIEHSDQITLAKALEGRREI